MSKIKNIIVISIFSILLFNISGCSKITNTSLKKTTSTEVQLEKTSPNGEYKAISYLFTDGGATVAFRRGISIINADEKVGKFLLENSPNIYLNNNSNYETMDIEWKDDETLKVNFTNIEENESYTVLKVDEFNSIKIEYEY